MSDADHARRTAVYLLDQVLGEGRLLAECYAAGALRSWHRKTARGRSGWPWKPCAAWSVPTGS